MALKRPSTMRLMQFKTELRSATSHRHVVVWALFLLGVMGSGLHAQDVELNDLGIGEREPFDRIILNAENDDTVLEVFPLNFPGGRPPENPPGSDLLRFRLVDRPQYLFEVPWSAVVDVELYADMLLEEAKSLIDQQQYDKAFPALARLLRDYSSTPGLNDLQLRFLYENARQLLEQDRGYAAIAVLDELERLDSEYRPSSEGLTPDQMVSQVLDAILAAYIRDSRFAKAEEYMTLIGVKYGASQQGVIDKWRGEIKNVALGHMAEARRYLEEGDGRRAQQAVRRMFGILRDVEGADELAAEIMERFPLVLVAVSQTTRVANPNSLTSWASRRHGRMSYATLLEYGGQGQDGGVYTLPEGDIELSEDRKSIRFELRPRADSDFVAPLDVYQFSRRLFNAADSSHADYKPAWARLVESLEIENGNRLRVDLRFPHILPEAYLTLPYVAREGESDTLGIESFPGEPNGPYVSVETLRPDRERRFQVNAMYREQVDKNWPEVVEQLFESNEEAVTALERSDIDVIEQVFPADLARLRENPDIVVERYELPLMHMLIPNQRSALMKFVVFRRAILYGTNRELILKSLILGGAPLEGAELISGPFPVGIDDSDPLNYAYNFKIQPIPYEPLLARTLVRLSEIQLEDELEQERIERGETGQVEEGEKQPIRLVLIHPRGDVARVACQAMAKQMATIGIELELRELAPGEVYPPNEDWDLLFTEVVMSEPLVDARRLLGPEGLAKIEYPPIDLALRRLDASESWAQARRRLYELHMLAFNEVAVLPLWQLPQYHARRQTLSGVGSGLQSLYDPVEAWELNVRGADDE